jgi:hypothetical protein
MQVIDPLNLPRSFTITQARAADLGEHPRLLDGFLYAGLTVLFSEPGLGKSMLSAAVEEHLAFGRPFGIWTPEHAHRCLVLDFEGDMRLASERSLSNTPWGLLQSDHGRPMPADIEYETEFPGDGFFGRLGALEQRLEGAVRQGQPYAYVRIDTMRLFLGSKPHGVNAYEWDAQCIGRLNRLALHYRVALVMVHHTNKAGEVSGSTGVAGSAVVVCQLKRNPDNDDECLLLSHKVRVDAPFRYPVVMDDRGRWEFTEDITPTQAMLGGTKRSLVNLLTSRGPKVMADIKAVLPDLNQNTIKTALRRLSDEHIVTYRHGMWQLTQTTVREHPKCVICGTPMEVYERGQTMHPTCHPDPREREVIRTWLGTPKVPAPGAPADADQAAEHREGEPPEEWEQEEEDHDHPEVQKYPAIAQMKASIAVSRMHPLANVKKVERDNAPWTLVTEKMDGHFRTRSWSGAVPEGTTHVALFDRNGSYPSAMSSVPLAPNALKHTGPLGTDREARSLLAGLFQIRVPEWTDPRIPHPLGRTAEVGVGAQIWITSSHLEFLDDLRDREGTRLFPEVDVLDSWTGRRNTSLFERYYKWVRVVRAQTQGDPAAASEAKTRISRATRLLHPKTAKSPFYRPDWHKSVLAQASVRHWVKAFRAVEQKASLLSIGAVDEVAFAVPADVQTPELWVPPGYKLGTDFGQVKHKEVPVGEEEFMSPVTVEIWAERGRRGKR